MSDPRLNSLHLGLSPRRQQYRDAREALLRERGWLTLAAEHVNRLVGESDDRPGPVLPGTNYLLVEDLTGVPYRLQTGLNTVGRLPDNDIVLEDLWVSRRHCVLLLHAWGGCELHDTASRNGTLVNGRRVRSPVRLASGDRIQICQRLLLFLSEEDYRAECLGDDHPSTIGG
jgi:hypothetical protein